MITERAIKSAAKTDPEWVFRNEVLCQWNDSTSDGPFPAGAWEGTLDEKSQVANPEEIAWCVDVSWDRSTAHLYQPVLDLAANTAATRPVGDAWAWDRRKSPADAAPLVAVTGALWCLNQTKKKRSGVARF
jgi:hypothetical protein